MPYLCNNSIMRKFRIYMNAPITLSFVGICLVVLLLDLLSGGESTYTFFCTYGSSFLNPMTYIRLIGHVFGHANLSHLISNALYILLLGPILEEKYHDKLIIVILVTALVTGLIHNLLEPYTILLGASGICFAFILLASITGKSEGIPITLILVALLYLGEEIYTGIVNADSISQLTHILGGLSGALLGLMFKER